MLGLFLGAALSLSSSPSYLVALRAGKGFEETSLTSEQAQNIYSEYPRIQHNLKPRLTFVSEEDFVDRIDEGLSIKLPANGRIIIGSDPGQAHIFIPGLPLKTAIIQLQPGKTFLVPQPGALMNIRYRGEEISSDYPIRLKHNDMVTFCTDQPGYNGKRFFRFVYYSRFFDPLA